MIRKLSPQMWRGPIHLWKTSQNPPGSPKSQNKKQEMLWGDIFFESFLILIVVRQSSLNISCLTDVCSLPPKVGGLLLFHDHLGHHCYRRCGARTATLHKLIRKHTACLKSLNFALNLPFIPHSFYYILISIALIVNQTK